MSTLRSKLALYDPGRTVPQIIYDQDPLLIEPDDFSNETLRIDVLIVSSAAVSKLPNVTDFIVKCNQHCQRIVFAVTENQPLDFRNLSGIRIDRFIAADKLDTDHLHDLWQDLRQREQDETYLSLSTELNQQYEILKVELETKLTEKSKNIIESRKQIFEINNRVEVLRKSLYSTTEVKSLSDAESALNDLLVKFNMITWFKIVPLNESDRFESDLKSNFESTVYSSQMSIKDEIFKLYFFKGDKRPFRKSDINYFNKLTEALDINLNRYNNLLALQKSERLFDLAFHSSPHPIIIVDRQYNVYQANLAAEKNAPDGEEHPKCYQMLFARQKPCPGCQFGTKFEMQKDFQTFAVQSNKYTNSLDTENQYWVHLYEDISEEKALEGKFQQAAKLSEVGLISSSIAHELNNPLGGILSYLQIMKMELAGDHPFQADIQFLTDAAIRMKKHIEDLLVFSRKEDVIKIERTNLLELLVKNLDLMQMQFKKEHLVVSFNPTGDAVWHDVSVLHFRNTLHLVFQFLLNKLRSKRQNKGNFSGIVEVKISQDSTYSYLSFSSNLGPHDNKLNSNDLSLITLEKSVLDQGFQVVISEPQPLWMQVLIKMPHKKSEQF